MLASQREKPTPTIAMSIPNGVGGNFINLPDSPSFGPKIPRCTPHYPPTLIPLFQSFTFYSYIFPSCTSAVLAVLLPSLDTPRPALHYLTLI
jgi:hypothetical protein